MSDGGQDTRYSLSGWLSWTLGICLAVAISWGVGWLQSREEYKRQYAPTAYADAAKRDAERTCLGTEPKAVFECVNEKVETAYQTAHDEQDLSAQQRAASASLIATVISFAALLITAIGVWFVKRTLDATLEAVADTGKATAAIVRQNDLVQAAQRAWIGIEPRVLATKMNPNSIQIQWRVEFRNLGQTIARNVSYRATVETMHTDALREAILNEFVQIQLVEDVIEEAIIPGGDLWLGGELTHSNGHLPWNKNDRCHILIIARADYLIEGSAELRTAARAFAIGFSDKDMFKQRLFERSDLTDLRLERIACFPIGPTIAT